MMGAAAGFHRNDAGRELRGQAHDSFALHATPQNDFARGIKPGDAAAVLTQINAENRDIHGCAPCFRIAPYQLSRRGGPSIRGAFVEAIGRSRGGRTTAIHALTDALGRPRVLRVAPGNMHDVMMAPDLLSAAGPIRRLIADKAYDTNQLRNLLVQLDIDAVIPSIARRKPLIPHDREAYRQRNLIERMFARLKDFRRVATRYDKLAANFLASVLIAAIVIWWLN
jgi:transposase